MVSDEEVARRLVDEFGEGAHTEVRRSRGLAKSKDDRERWDRIERLVADLLREARPSARGVQPPAQGEPAEAERSQAEAERALLDLLRLREQRNFTVTITCRDGKWIVSTQDYDTGAAGYGTADAFAAAWFGRTDPMSRGQEDGTVKL